MILFFLTLKHFLYLPQFSLPTSKDPSHRSFCKGWWCDSSQGENQNSNQLKTILTAYQNGTISSLHKNISSLISHGYSPAKCVAGFFYMLGLADYRQNPTKSQKLLKQGAENTCFACSEILAFHPLTEHKTYHIKKANEQGSLLAKYLLVNKEVHKEKPRYDKILDDVYHLGTITSLSWHTKHKSGMIFANSVVKLTTDPQTSKQNWQIMYKLGETGHPLAALWIVESVLSNRTRMYNSKQAFDLISRHIFNGPWINFYTSLAFTSHNFNKTTALHFFSEAGDKAAAALLSYPQLFTH